MQTQLKTIVSTGLDSDLYLAEEEDRYNLPKINDALDKARKSL